MAKMFKVVAISRWTVCLVSSFFVNALLFRSSLSGPWREGRRHRGRNRSKRWFLIAMTTVFCFCICSLWLGRLDHCGSSGWKWRVQRPRRPHLRIIFRNIQTKLQECQGAAQPPQEEEATRGGGAGAGGSSTRHLPQVWVWGQHQEVQLPLLHGR